MNGSIRVSAKTVDDAITEAMIQLGVTSDKLEYTVIEKGNAGFLFGIGLFIFGVLFETILVANKNIEYVGY